jgi:glycosyltransferase involved in cell wall biosynthesis
MKKATISAVVNTCNEEKYIEQCLQHLKWADEIVIVDMYSEDKTVEICKKYTDNIYFHQREISVLYARNFALSRTTGDWILVVDPDEIIPESLSEKILELINSNPDFTAISFPFRTLCFGKWIKHAFPVEWHIRCFKKGSVSFTPRVHSLPQVKGNIHTLPHEKRFSVIHENYESVSQFIQKMNRYATDEAKHMHEDDRVRFRSCDLIKKPVSEFIHRYFLRKGYKDGMEGFVFSVLMAIYRFSIYAKLWEIQKRSLRK